MRSLLQIRSSPLAYSLRAACLLGAVGCGPTIGWVPVTSPPRPLSPKASVVVYETPSAKPFFVVGELSVQGESRPDALRLMSGRAATIGCEALVYRGESRVASRSTGPTIGDQLAAGWINAVAQDADRRARKGRYGAADFAGDTATTLLGAFVLEALAGGGGDSSGSVTTVHSGTCILEMSTIAPWYDEDCAKGHSQECALLAQMYEIGAGVPEDEARASKLYAQACNAEHLAACHETWERFKDGKVAAGDLARVQDGYTDACEKRRNLRACGFLGLMYANGDGVPRDRDKAIDLLGRACKRSGLGCARLKSLEDEREPIAPSPPQ